MIAGIIIGVLLGTGGVLLWQRFCCRLDEAFERLCEGEE